MRSTERRGGEGSLPKRLTHPSMALPPHFCGSAPALLWHWAAERKTMKPKGEGDGMT